uniref:Reverse transcriptase domain-containing protein n=1 Tax=Scylla olivacea TaxID=85551 RepID=A0A0P4VPS6_SCYOL
MWHHGLIAKLNSMGVRCHLLLLLQDNLRGRYLRVVVNGHSSNEHPISASVPQGSVLGPLLWNAFFNDLLHLIPEAHAFADNCTLTFPCDNDEPRKTIAHINQVLQTTVSWDRRWQVDLASEKTQVLLVSRRHRTLDTPIPAILLDGRPLSLLTSISILGVEVNGTLSFTGHVKTIARRAAGKLTCIRRVSHLLDSQGITALYAAQVRSLMEYATLTWSCCPPSYLGLLNKVQNRVQCLIRLKAPPDQPPPSMQPLQQRRDVAGLYVLYKTQKQCAPHLDALRLPWAQPHGHTTRAAITRNFQLIIPFAKTETFLRSFFPRYTRIWNKLLQQTQDHCTNSLNTFKSAVND